MYDLPGSLLHETKHCERLAAAEVSSATNFYGQCQRQLCLCQYDSKRLVSMNSSRINVTISTNKAAATIVSNNCSAKKTGVRDFQEHFMSNANTIITNTGVERTDHLHQLLRELADDYDVSVQAAARDN